LVLDIPESSFAVFFPKRSGMPLRSTCLQWLATAVLHRIRNGLYVGVEFKKLLPGCDATSWELVFARLRFELCEFERIEMYRVSCWNKNYGKIWRTCWTFFVKNAKFQVLNKNFLLKNSTGWVNRSRRFVFEF
jgi:hypothetical protein